MSEGNVFFITGSQRSGTTLLSVILGNHSEVDIDGFARAFRLVSCLKDYTKVLPAHLQYSEDAVLQEVIAQDFKGRLAQFTDYKNLAEYDSLKDFFAEAITKQLAKSNKSVWGDKTPNMHHYLGDLLMTVPQAKIIHIVRDGRATAQSQAARAQEHILLAANDWVKGNILALVNQKLLGKKQHLIVRYEDLLSSPEQTVKKICDFLNLEFQPEMLRLKNENEEKSYVKSKFDTTKIDAYKTEIPEKTLRKIEAIQAPLLNKLAYDLSYPDSLNKHRLLSPFRVILYRQLSNFKSLFQSKRMGMVNRKNVEVKLSFRNRLSKFLLLLGHDFLGKEVYFHFRDKKILRKKLFED